MSTFETALALVRDGRTGALRDRKKVGNNTWAVWDESEQAVKVRLHDTDVVKFSATGSVTLDSGGWRTVTTKKRLNDWAPGVSVYSRDGVWFVRTVKVDESGVWRFVDVVNEVRFYDGVTYLPATGEIVSDGPRLDAEVERADAVRLLRERVRKFVMLLEDAERCREFVAAVVQGGSWAGDCWYCLMRDESGVPLGDASGSHEHLLDHLDDEYLVPSLFLNAFRERFGESGDQRLWIYAVDLDNGFGKGQRREVSRTLGDYFVKRLIEGGK